jgi:hypothetical protein
VGRKIKKKLVVDSFLAFLLIPYGGGAGIFSNEYH